MIPPPIHSQTIRGWMRTPMTAVSDPAALALWQRDLPDAFFTAYLTALAAGPLADQTRWQG